ncbi:MAG: hypothetical protein A3F94_00050 [Candidatus Spechtbacteria bacterium RIFCSPLOWO2_12_FULL_38_22]|uniref:Uncharacterized protein n=1 Tax=Candidatus Spechtbacteria bacterium RIFCSPLOWO2_12_FULL_38_22 TaxID=1802165 RepID=A0A1G2HGI9_9BACT|nr:MAG: hypothetical protein A2728_02530 [Candidatus Spechtbacteria bacterium RIFCSPHIGHO2_01_FULL_38_11]OGZ59195.1 MAG: hypothetical protein A3E58_00050 [Candidatus Spechtbacteria bacterium RIFCSPHIGHO2_12_FULL_38_30]OGZ61614.1 MAG: hypothetical protein A3F94_00050 [Candidatus Spechtbacteria bacterium RIFCSPLOWO2_12_FULL_38_22]
MNKKIKNKTVLTWVFVLALLVVVAWYFYWGPGRDINFLREQQEQDLTTGDSEQEITQDLQIIEQDLGDLESELGDVEEELTQLEGEL